MGASTGPGSAFAVTVLGSGGPIANNARASSGYVVWPGDRSPILVDAGGGIFVRIGQIGLDVAAIDHVLLTHTHIDHTGGLGPFIMAASMAGRTRPIAVAGPAGRGMHPGCQRFTDLLFGSDGAWSYMTTFDGFGITAQDMPSAVGEDGPTVVLERDDLLVRSVAVPHGMMPAVAYRIDYAGASVVFSGDVQEETRGFLELARDCDVLIHDQAVPEYQVPHSHLHTRPSVTGKIARDVRCRRLVLSHFMPEIEQNLVAAVEMVQDAYGGDVELAHDLMVIDITAPRTHPDR